MGILTRPRFLPQQRLDLEDVNALLSALRTDSKLYTKQFLSPNNLVYKGFTVSGVGLKSATVAMADATLIIPQNTNDFSWYTAAPSEPNIVIPDADLTDGVRNYIEIELLTEDNTPLTKAFWDPEANSGLGSEFNQIVETVTDLTVNFVVSVGGFSGSPDRVPLCIIDTDGSGTIKTILDRRNLFGRLGTPTNIDNVYNWGTRQEPGYSLTLTGVSGTFTTGETIDIGTETAIVSAGGTTAIAFIVPSGINFFPGDTVTGQSSGATGTVNTITESFAGADKNLKCQKDINDAVMTELKLIKGTRFWYEDPGVSLGGIVKFFESLLVQATATAKFAWDGTELQITDDNVSPGNDTLAYIRILGRSDDIIMTREDGTGGTSPIAIADGEVLYVKLPVAGGSFSGTGVGDTNYQVVDIGSYVSSDTNYWLAYREGTRLYIRGYGELEPGEEINIGDPELENILAQIALNQTYANMDRNMKIIEGGTWSLVGNVLTLSADAYIEIPGLTNDRNTVAAQNVTLPNANSVAYVEINRTAGATSVRPVTVANADTLLTNNNNIVIIARKVSTGVLVGTHSFLLKTGEFLEMDGALAEINRYMGQLKIKNHETDLNKARINAADSALLNGQTLSQSVGNFLLKFTGAVINFTTGVITKEDGVTALGTNFTPFSVPSGQYFWYGVSLIPGAVDTDNMQLATVQIDLADSANASQSAALKPVITGDIKLGAIQVRNNAGNIEVVDVRPLGVGSGSGSGSGQGASFDAEMRAYLKLSPYEFVTQNILAVDQDGNIDPASTGSYSPANKTFEMAVGETLITTELLDPDFISENRVLGKTRVILRYAEGEVDTAPVVEVSKNGGAYEAITMNRIGTTDTFDGELNLDNAVGTSLVMRITASMASQVFAYGVMYDTTFTAIPYGIAKNVHTVVFSGNLNQNTFTLPFIPDANSLEVFDKELGLTYVYSPNNITFTLSGNDVVFVTNFFNRPGDTIELEFRQIQGNGFDNSDQNANAIAALQSLVAELSNQGHKNYVQNAEFRYFQRQNPTTLTNRQDATFGPDRMKMVTSGGAVNTQCARISDFPAGSPTSTSAQFRQADATARQFGVYQMMETNFVKELSGKQVTFGCWVRTDGTEVPNISAGIIEWTGTSNSITSDIVSSWAATPTLVANASFLGTVTSAITGTWSYISVTANVTNSMNNLGFMIWTPATVAQNSDFYVSQVQLVRGPSVRPWERISLTPDQDLSQCQRYFEKTFDVNQEPASNTGLFQGTIAYRCQRSGAGALEMRQWFYKVMKRTNAVSFTFFNPQAAGSNWRNATDTTNSGAVSVGNISETNVMLTNTQVAADTIDDLIGVHATAEVEIF